jgi:hypothetical protein
VDVSVSSKDNKSPSWFSVQILFILSLISCIFLFKTLYHSVGDMAKTLILSLCYTFDYEYQPKCKASSLFWRL